MKFVKAEFESIMSLSEVEIVSEVACRLLECRDGTISKGKDSLDALEAADVLN